MVNSIIEVSILCEGDYNMSLIITVYCNEGIVMASDSRATYSYTETLPPPDKNMPPLIVRENGAHLTDNAYKTFLTPNGIGVSVCGCSSINGNSITGIIEEFLLRNNNLSVSELTKKIHTHFSNLPLKDNIEFVIAGYEQHDGCFNQIIHRVNTKSPDIEVVDTTQSGALWGGESDILSRLICDLYLRHEHQDGTETYTRHTGYPIPWSFFTLQDSIDFAEYGIRTTIDAMKFQRRVKTVGGPIDVLVIKPTGSKWISHKELHSTI